MCEEKPATDSMGSPSLRVDARLGARPRIGVDAPTGAVFVAVFDCPSMIPDGIRIPRTGSKRLHKSGSFRDTPAETSRQDTIRKKLKRSSGIRNTRRHQSATPTDRTTTPASPQAHDAAEPNTHDHEPTHAATQSGHDTPSTDPTAPTERSSPAGGFPRPREDADDAPARHAATCTLHMPRHCGGARWQPPQSSDSYCAPTSVLAASSSPVCLTDRGSDTLPCPQL